MAKIVLKDFYAEWCGPCRVQTPIIKELEEEFKGKIVFEKINVDNKRDEASKYGVRSIPTIIIEKDGNVKERFTGLQEKKVLKSALSKLL
ncbi:thioredoxin [archaeon CG_4_10_14_0_2_um_filter_Archaea_38_6]|nr:MAG: thioredoxin [archaeon CG07_land_8_20_14_0_80_38_8]PIU89472.1 MAG: thioredoxin [archaeon CG06_land_8_20_14_3_00_37_11]PIX43045.1 MAG: thioredoxin [archaeon CG_4_8_14_3_um_filter_38_5]PJA22178.1 MAG: thioredoxin [archaeon CG_4_10_14_0_2_um_filter_Archaea_38_6]